MPAVAPSPALLDDPEDLLALPSHCLPVVPGEMPEPYRGLLAHPRDMTSTLEGHHREEVRLRVLARVASDDTLVRSVLLVGTRTGRPVELGAIRIQLAPFEAAVRERVLEGSRPLGGILEEAGFGYTSRPRGYFCLPSTPSLEDAFELVLPTVLYGRANTLRTAAGALLAEVVEILPPASAT